MSPAPTSYTDPLRDKRILIIDDEPDVCEMAAEILHDADRIEVTWVTAYDDARERLGSGQLDAAVLDIMGVRGFELLAEFGERIPMVVLTANALTASDLRRAIELKARAYIPKGELAHLPKYLRVALSVDDLDDLWGIWLWQPVDLVNINVHLGPNWRDGDEAAFFRRFSDRIAKPNYSVAKLEKGVADIVHNAPPLNEFTPSDLVSYQRIIEQMKADDDVEAVILRSGLPPGYPPMAVNGAARRLPFGLGKTRLGRRMARLVLRLRYPGIHRTRTFGVGLAVEAIQNEAMIEVSFRFGLENFLETFYYPKPFVSLVEGLALAGHLELASCAHCMVATPRALFSLPEFRLAFPPPGGIPLLAHRVGDQRAFMMAVESRLVTAREALQLGLIDRIVPARRARQEAARLARRLVERQAIFGLEQTRRQKTNLRAKLNEGFDTWMRVSRTPKAAARIERFLKNRAP